MRSRFLTLVGLALLPVSASAQTFNIDVGNSNAFNGNGSPSNAYGGAAGVPGQWTYVDVAAAVGVGNFTSAALTDINGATTGVTLAFDVLNPGDTYTTLDADEPTATGDDALLMEDIMYCIGTLYTATFSGMAPGNYDVYTYAMAPDSATLESLVDVPAGTGGAQGVGGAFPAAGHVQGITYSLHTVTVAPGGDLVVLIDTNSGDDSLNGFQIAPAGAGQIGTNYCGPGNPNTTGMPGLIAAFGSNVAADNNLTLRASQLPTGQFAYIICSRTQGFVPNPQNSQGNLCVLGSIARFNQAGQIGSIVNGEFVFQVPLNNIPEPPAFGVTAMAGDTWNFQCWHRDFIQGQGATSNFTDALEVVFQ